MKNTPLSVFLRNFLVRKHFWFSCCASCGEIKTPVGNRLCASLRPDFSVDAVIRQPGTPDGQALGRVKAYHPWLNNIFFAPETERPETLHETPGHAQCLPAECFLVAENTDALCTPSITLDFFTPNGIPLIALSRLPDVGLFTAPETELCATLTRSALREPPVYANTRRNAADFLPVFRRMPDVPYSAALAWWSYKQGRGVLMPERSGHAST
jgi:hypothetical protein